jgi:tRNA(Ile)-lysidine synthase
MTSRFGTAVADAVGERPCVVALGGGADSAMLLHATQEASHRNGVRAVFANHGLASSHLLERAARELVDRLDIDLTVVDAPIVDGPDLEARARHARYTAIEAAVAQDELVLTGHTADDQAETVLMRLMRGSGAGGLAGIPARRGPWTRPFLTFSRRELRAEAERLGLPFTDDPGNEDDRFLRSRIRNHLLPLIEEAYAPGIATNLARTAALVLRDDEYLNSLTTPIAVTIVSGTIALPAPALVSAPLPLATRAVRSALRRCGDAYPGSMDDVEAALEVARTGTTAAISGGIQVRRESPLLMFFTSTDELCDPNLEIEGVSSLHASSFGWGRHAYTVDRASYPVAIRTAGRFSVVSIPEHDVDVGVRPVSEGDRIDIGTGSTPILEVMRDHGIPPSDRPCWPLVTIGGRIAAIHGVRTGAWAMPHDGDDILIIEREGQL